VLVVVVVVELQPEHLLLAVVVAVELAYLDKEPLVLEALLALLVLMVEAALAVQMAL
jgi:hypothetical protein